MGVFAYSPAQYAITPAETQPKLSLDVYMNSTYPLVTVRGHGPCAPVYTVRCMDVGCTATSIETSLPVKCER